MDRGAYACKVFCKKTCKGTNAKKRGARRCRRARAASAALGQELHDGGDSLDVCPVSLVKGSTAGTYKPKHQCKLVGALSYSLGARQKSNANSPCTNRPVKCDTCTYQTIWSYSLQRHYELKHPGVAVPPAMQAAMNEAGRSREGVAPAAKGGEAAQAVQDCQLPVPERVR